MTFRSLHWSISAVAVTAGTRFRPMKEGMAGGSNHLGAFTSVAVACKIIDLSLIDQVVLYIYIYVCMYVNNNIGTNIL